MTDYSSEDFWKGAPEGATHYLPADAKRSWDACWYKQNSLGQWLGWNAENYYRCIRDEWTVDNDQVEAFTAALIQRSSCAKPAPWPGDGLPPVGTVCEMHIDGGKWVFGTVVVHIDLDRPVAVAHNGEDVFHGYAGDFRPIKTPAQIAAEERDAAIEAMWNIYWQPSAPTAKEALGLLWDAGLRFPKGDAQ